MNSTRTERNWPRGRWLQRGMPLVAAPRAGLTMLEITIAVMVFASAMIPILMMTTTTSKRTFSMEKHLVAGQFAQGVLDRLLAMTFDECKAEIAKGGYPRKVLDDPSVKGSGSGGGKLGDVLDKSFKDFQYEVKMTEPDKADEKGQMVTISVSLSWPSDAGSKVVRQFSLSAVKFLENP